MNKRTLLRMLVIGCVILIFAAGVVFAAGKEKATGMMTSIENDGTVIIQDKKGQLNGYLLSPSVAVQDHKGNRKLLKELQMPLKVYVEYEYTTKGFMITLIKEVAE